MNESARLEAKSRSSIQNQPVPSAGLDSVDRTHGDPEENVHGPSRLNEVQSSDRSPFSKTECSREIFLLKELRAANVTPLRNVPSMAASIGNVPGSQGLWRAFSPQPARERAGRFQEPGTA
jgi:hypothetical protein